MAKIVLLQDVPQLGRKGAIVDVKEGYAANFLYPRRLARLATQLDEQKAQDMQHQEETAAKNKQRIITKFISLASSQLVKNPIKIEVKTAVGGRVFGSVDANQVIAGLVAAMPQLKALRPEEFQIKIPQRIEYVGKYVFEMVVNLDGSQRNDQTVIPIYVDVISVSEAKKKSTGKWRNSEKIVKDELSLLRYNK